MPNASTFTGTQEELLQALAGENAARVLDEEASLSVLEFLNAHGATIRAAADQSDSLEVRLTGPVFLSVRKFVWGSAAAILGLAVAIITNDSSLIASAAEVVGNLLSSISIFPSDTTEFKAYSAVAALQKEHPASGPSVDEVSYWLKEKAEVIADKELRRGLEALLDRQLLRRAGEDRVRIAW
jgi:hypothetical protein